MLPRAARNPHSWDRASNLLVLEHPPGVGFSYCVDERTGARAVCRWDDASQALAFHAALEAFYEVRGARSERCDVRRAVRRRARIDTHDTM